MKKKIIITTYFLVLLLLIAGCNKEKDMQQIIEGDDALSFSEEAFNISTLYDTSGNAVNIVPNETTIYAYFTGVG